MVVLLYSQLVIIVIETLLILWLRKEYIALFTDGDKEKTSPKKEQTQKQEKPLEQTSSIIGQTQSIMLSPKVEAVIPPDEIDNAFEHIELDMEGGDYDEVQEEIPQEEQSEVVSIGNSASDVDGNIENEQIQKETCCDYFQIQNGIKNKLSGSLLDGEARRILDILEGSELGEQINHSISKNDVK